MSLAKPHSADISPAALPGTQRAGDNYFRLIEDIAKCATFEVLVLSSAFWIAANAIKSEL